MVVPSRKQVSVRGTKNVYNSGFKHIPQHLWTEIFARVASQSIPALSNVKMCSKSFLEAASESYVFEHATLKKFPVLFKNVGGASSFFKQCKDFGNSEALFLQGLKDFFDGLKIELGLELLNKAVDKKHPGAKYVYGIILACHGGRHKEKGLKLLHSLTTSESKSTYLIIRKCRKEVKRAFTGMWLHNKLVENDVINFRDYMKQCNCNEKRMTSDIGGKNKSAWDVKDYDEGLYNTSSCESCLWDNEVIQFRHMLKTGSFKV
ncbi:hypothetical protein K2173_002677 [Erythroxylum novogranatense]|uniref:At2g35280-like TPR domain-containing protein n=1 Tax=Erythroxylum novogranatense TaxID=1862640 RepID=A0AAV8SXY8_9ROSI|nr:hypothetical protein K2173_002677 [Erythroxylum novogranatense]